jgi:hypothetical protein
MRSINRLLIMTGVFLPVCALELSAADVYSLRDKLNRYYKQHDSDLRTEQQLYRYEEGRVSPRRQQRLTEQLNRQRVGQQRLQREQTRQIAPSTRSFSAPGLQGGTPGRRRADSPTLQRFQRQHRQQRLDFRNQRRGWR